jgi:hypothetical protein
MTVRPPQALSLLFLQSLRILLLWLFLKAQLRSIAQAAHWEYREAASWQAALVVQ